MNLHELHCVYHFQDTEVSDQALHQVMRSVMCQYCRIFRPKGQVWKRIYLCCVTDRTNRTRSWSASPTSGSVSVYSYEHN